MTHPDTHEAKARELHNLVHRKNYEVGVLAIATALREADAAAVVKMAKAEVTPKMIAAAWAAWHSRHGGRLGPGPAFAEAITAAIRALPLDIGGGDGL